MIGVIQVDDSPIGTKRETSIASTLLMISNPNWLRIRKQDHDLEHRLLRLLHIRVSAPRCPFLNSTCLFRVPQHDGIDKTTLTV